MTEMKLGTGQTKHKACLYVIAAMAALGAYTMSATPAAAMEPPPKGKSPIIDRIRDSGTMRVGINVALPWLGQNPPKSPSLYRGIETSVLKTAEKPAE